MDADNNPNNPSEKAESAERLLSSSPNIKMKDLILETQASKEQNGNCSKPNNLDS